MKTKDFLLCALLLSSAVSARSQNTNHGTGAGNSGTNNTSIGAYAGDVVTGGSNVFVGYWSGKSNTIGNYNAFVGKNSGFANISGEFNAFVGNSSGEGNTTGSYNCFFGPYSGASNTTGDYNVFQGRNAGYFNTTGSKNVAIGGLAYSSKTGTGNIIIGYSAGSVNTNTSPLNNVIIGHEAGKNSNGNAVGNIFLGYQAGLNELGSNKLIIDNSGTATPLIYGDFATDKVGINSLPNTTHTLTVGGTIHSTGLYVNGVLVSGDLSLWERNGTNVYTQSTLDNIGIGTTLVNNPNSYKLAVNGKIGAKEVQIENTSLTWPDFVFKTDYQLMTLAEVEAFIKTNGHLPEVPSEEQVLREGIRISELNAKLLQKIEELTLYVIELKKEVDALKNSKE